GRQAPAAEHVVLVVLRLERRVHPDADHGGEVDHERDDEEGLVLHLFFSSAPLSSAHRNGITPHRANSRSASIPGIWENAVSVGDGDTVAGRSPARQDLVASGVAERGGTLRYEHAELLGVEDPDAELFGL